MGALKKIKRTWFLALICCVVYSCYVISYFYVEKMEKETEAVTLASQENGWSLEEVKRMRQSESEEEHPADFCVWGEQRNQLVENQEFDRSYDMTILAVDGEPALISGDFEKLTCVDAYGCLIDETSAYHLFGSREAVGEELSYGGRTFIIRGVLLDVKGLLVAHADAIGDIQDEEPFALSMVSLQIPESADRQVYVQNFCSRHAMLEVRLELSMFAHAAQFLSWLFPVLLAAFALAPFFRNGGKKRRPIVNLCVFFLGIGLSFVFLKLTQLKWQISASMLPTKWSDFDFWGALFKQRQDALDFLLHSQKPRAQLAVLYDLLTVFGFSMAAVVGIVCLRRHVRIRTWRQVFMGSLLSFLCVFFVCLFFLRKGAALPGAGSAGIWLLGSAACVAGRLGVLVDSL